MSEPVLATEELTRYFGERAAVDRLTFSVPQGSVFGLLGRNGSGKTTTIRMLLGLLAPTRGSATVLGQDVNHLSPETKARIGYMVEGHPAYRWMKTTEAERFCSRFQPHWNSALFHRVIEHFSIAAQQKAAHLSRGQRAGLCLALTLGSEPELLILDDPALGLDPLARQALLESIVYLTRDSQCTILFSSHQLSDIERVADRIAILDRGVLRACCSLDTFRARIRHFVFDQEVPDARLGEVPGLLKTIHDQSQTRLILVAGDQDPARLLAERSANGVHEEEIDLEEAILAYLGDRGRTVSFFEAVGGQ